jgi:rhodanese-related sulfurtransferase
MSPPPPGITVQELAGRLARGEPLAVLDVREPQERAFCSIPLPASAVDLHVPMSQITSRLVALRAAFGGRTTVVYCHHGVRSRMAAEWLTGQGVPGVVNLEGGIDDWSEAIDPTVPRY